MASNEFECAADLMGRDIVVSRRCSAIWCEIEVRCVGVISSVQGDFCAGVIEVEGPCFNADGIARYPIDLALWAIDSCSG